MANANLLQACGTWASHTVIGSYRGALAAIVSLIILGAFPSSSTQADTIFVPRIFDRISIKRLSPYLMYRQYTFDGRLPAEPCRSSLEALLTIDCFKSEYDVNADDEPIDGTMDLAHYPAFTKIEASFEVSPKARKIDLSSFELQAILAAFPFFQARYEKLDGRRIQVIDSRNFIGVQFYDPDISSGCRGNCGRGSVTVILSKPGLHYVRSVFPR